MAQATSGLERTKNTDELELENTESRDAEKIHAQIEETRSNLSETIDAIQDRLSLSNISEQVSEQVSNAIESAKDSVYDATIGKATHFIKQTGDGIMNTSAAKTIKSNPIPFALIAAGSGLLIYNAYGKGNSRKRPAGYTTDPYAPGQYDSRSKGLVSNAAQTVAEKTGSALGSVSDVANSTYEKTTEIASKAYDKVGELGTSAQQSYEYYVDEKPLALAAAAVAVGAAIGFAIPSTNFEGEMMGEARQNLLSKAEDAANDLVDKARDVAADAGQLAS